MKKQLTDKRYHKTTPDLQQTTRRDDYTALADNIGLQQARKEAERGQTQPLNAKAAVEINGHVDINVKTNQTKTETVTN